MKRKKRLSYDPCEILKFPYEPPEVNAQFRIEEIDFGLASKVCNAWKVTTKGIDIARSVCFGAEYCDRYFAIAIWERNKDNSIFELKVYELCDEVPQDTNFGKYMLSMMIRLIRRKFKEVKKFVSYCEDKNIYSSRWKCVATMKLVDAVKKREMGRVRWEYNLDLKKNE